MKVLMVSGTFPPRKFGGVTAVSYNIAKRLVVRGHEVFIYTTDVGNDSHSRLDIRNSKVIDGIHVRHFKNVNNSLAFKQRLYSPIGMITWAKKELKNFDVIHLHDYRSFQNVVIHYYAKKHAIPYVLQAHGSVLPFFSKERLKKLYDLVWGYRILEDASKVIALTTTEAKQYTKMGVDDNKIEIVPNGIDLSEYENLPDRGIFRKKYGIKSNEKIVLYLGRIHKIKGVDLLVEAFSDLTCKIEGVKLVIAGPDDGFLSTLKMQIEFLNIGDKILFTGPLYGMDKLEAYVDADVYVLPSVYETFPNTVLEACACGAPVIVTDRCGIYDLIKKVGYVVEYNKDQLQDAMYEILDNEVKRMKFGYAARELVINEFSWDNSMEKLEKIYLSAVS